MSEVRRIATKAGVKTLVLDHFVPGIVPIPDYVWYNGVKPHFMGRVIAGHDLMALWRPPSQQAERTHRADTVRRTPDGGQCPPYLAPQAVQGCSGGINSIAITIASSRPRLAG
jgi:hypothetical protein